MILRPTHLITENIVQVTIDGNWLLVRMDEKNETLRERLKAREFSWNWALHAWIRQVNAAIGPAADRAAETAHLLLATGFAVELANDLARMVMDVSYEPERRRRIMRRSRGEYDGWFVLVWPRDDGDDRACYAGFRAIPGSRYDKPWLVVPPDQYEAVQDFAERYSFWISPGAQHVIDEAATRRRSTVVFDPPPLPRPAAKSPEPADAVGGIDPDLADDI